MAPSTGPMQLLFFDTFSHDVGGNADGSAAASDLNIDLVQFPSPVYVREVRIIPLGARVTANFPGGNNIRLGATHPATFDLELFVNNLSAPGCSTFQSIGILKYSHKGAISLLTTSSSASGHGGRESLVTDGLLLRGRYSTVTLAVYGTVSDLSPEQLLRLADHQKQDTAVGPGGGRPGAGIHPDDPEPRPRPPETPVPEGNARTLGESYAAMWTAKHSEQALKVGPPEGWMHPAELAGDHHAGWRDSNKLKQERDDGKILKSYGKSGVTDKMAGGGVRHGDGDAVENEAMYGSRDSLHDHAQEDKKMSGPVNNFFDASGDKDWNSLDDGKSKLTSSSARQRRSPAVGGSGGSKTSRRYGSRSPATAPSTGGVGVGGKLSYQDQPSAYAVGSRTSKEGSLVLCGDGDRGYKSRSSSRSRSPRAGVETPQPRDRPRSSSSYRTGGSPHHGRGRRRSYEARRSPGNDSYSRGVGRSREASPEARRSTRYRNSRDRSVDRSRYGRSRTRSPLSGRRMSPGYRSRSRSRSRSPPLQYVRRRGGNRDRSRSRNGSPAYSDRSPPPHPYRSHHSDASPNRSPSNHRMRNFSDYSPRFNRSPATGGGRPRSPRCRSPTGRSSVASGGDYRDRSIGRDYDRGVGGSSPPPHGGPRNRRHHHHPASPPPMRRSSRSLSRHRRSISPSRRRRSPYSPAPAFHSSGKQRSISPSAPSRYSDMRRTRSRSPYGLSSSSGRRPMSPRSPEIKQSSAGWKTNSKTYSPPLSHVSGGIHHRGRHSSPAMAASSHNSHYHHGSGGERNVVHHRPASRNGHRESFSPVVGRAQSPGGSGLIANNLSVNAGPLKEHAIPVHSSGGITAGSLASAAKEDELLENVSDISEGDIPDASGGEEEEEQKAAVVGGSPATNSLSTSQSAEKAPASAEPSVNGHTAASGSTEAASSPLPTTPATDDVASQQANAGTVPAVIDREIVEDISDEEAVWSDDMDGCTTGGVGVSSTGLSQIEMEQLQELGNPVKIITVDDIVDIGDKSVQPAGLTSLTSPLDTAFTQRLSKHESLSICDQVTTSCVGGGGSLTGIVKRLTDAVAELKPGTGLDERWIEDLEAVTLCLQSELADIAWSSADEDDDEEEEQVDGETPAAPIRDLIPQMVKVGLASIDYSLALTQAKPTNKLRHIKSGIKFLLEALQCFSPDRLDRDGLSVCSALMEAGVQRRLLALYRTEHMTVPLKLLVLRAIDRTLDHPKGLEVFLRSGGGPADQPSLYSETVELLCSEGSCKSTRTRFAVSSLLQRLHLHEFLASFADTVDSITGIPDVESSSTHKDIDWPALIGMIDHLAESYRQIYTSLSHPARYLPCSRPLDLASSISSPDNPLQDRDQMFQRPGRAYFLAIDQHYVLERLAGLMSSPLAVIDDDSGDRLAMSVIRLLQLWIELHGGQDGVRYLAHRRAAVLLLVQAFLRVWSETDDDNRSDPPIVSGDNKEDGGANCSPTTPNRGNGNDSHVGGLARTRRASNATNNDDTEQGSSISDVRTTTCGLSPFQLEHNVASRVKHFALYLAGVVAATRELDNISFFLGEAAVSSVAPANDADSASLTESRDNDVDEPNEVVHTSLADEREFWEARLTESAQKLYGLTFSGWGRAAVARVLAIGDHIRSVILLTQHTVALKPSAGPHNDSGGVASPPSSKKSAARGYASELLLVAVRSSLDAGFVVRHAEQLGKAAGGNAGVPGSSSGGKPEEYKLSELTSWTKPFATTSAGQPSVTMDESGQIGPQSVPSLVDFIKKCISESGEKPLVTPEVITCARLLYAMAVAPLQYSHGLYGYHNQPGRSPGRERACSELRYQHAALAMFSCDLHATYVELLERLAEDNPQPQLCGPALAARGGAQLINLLLPLLGTLRALIELVIACRDTEFRDLTCVVPLVRTYRLLSALPHDNIHLGGAAAVCKQHIVATLLAFTQPTIHPAKDDLAKSQWSLMMREVLTELTTSCPSAYLPGVQLLSQLLPLPVTQTLTTTHINHRKFWSAHLHSLTPQLELLVSRLAPIVWPHVLANQFRFLCRQLASLAPPTASALLRAAVAGCDQSLIGPGKPLSPIARRWVEFLAWLITSQPHMKAVLLSQLQEEKMRGEFCRVLECCLSQGSDHVVRQAFAVMQVVWDPCQTIAIPQQVPDNNVHQNASKNDSTELEGASEPSSKSDRHDLQMLADSLPTCRGDIMPDLVAVLLCGGSGSGSTASAATNSSHSAVAPWAEYRAIQALVMRTLTLICSCSDAGFLAVRQCLSTKVRTIYSLLRNIAVEFDPMLSVNTAASPAAMPADSLTCIDHAVKFLLSLTDCDLANRLVYRQVKAARANANNNNSGVRKLNGGAGIVTDDDDEDDGGMCGLRTAHESAAVLVSGCSRTLRMSGTEVSHLVQWVCPGDEEEVGKERRRSHPLAVIGQRIRDALDKLGDNADLSARLRDVGTRLDELLRLLESVDEGLESLESVSSEVEEAARLPQPTPIMTLWDAWLQHLEAGDGSDGAEDTMVDTYLGLHSANPQPPLSEDREEEEETATTNKNSDEREKVDLLEIARKYLGKDFDLVQEAKLAYRDTLLTADQRPSKKAAAVKRSAIEAKAQHTKNIISTFRAGGSVNLRSRGGHAGPGGVGLGGGGHGGPGGGGIFGRIGGGGGGGPPGGPGPGGYGGGMHHMGPHHHHPSHHHHARSDAFRARPPNTSRPPSLHVDDFLVLELKGQQPTGPTGYNKQSIRAAKELFAQREAEKALKPPTQLREATREPVLTGVYRGGARGPHGPSLSGAGPNSRLMGRGGGPGPGYRNTPNGQQQISPQGHGRGKGAGGYRRGGGPGGPDGVQSRSWNNDPMGGGGYRDLGREARPGPGGGGGVRDGDGRRGGPMYHRGGGRGGGPDRRGWNSDRSGGGRGGSGVRDKYRGDDIRMSRMPPRRT